MRRASVTGPQLHDDDRVTAGCFPETHDVTSKHPPKESGGFFFWRQDICSLGWPHLKMALNSLCGLHSWESKCALPCLVLLVLGSNSEP